MMHAVDEWGTIARQEHMTNKHTWPSTIPDDLDVDLQMILGSRSRPLAADVWTTLREWLLAHKVDAPSNLPRAAERTTIPNKAWD